MSLSRSRFGLALLVGLVPLSAAAQQADTTAGEASGVHDVSKSPGRAALYSLGGTVLPVAGGLILMSVGERSASWGRVEVGTDLNQFGAVLVVGGLVAGPAAGHFYADARRRAQIGMGIRGGAAVVGIGAATVILFDTSFDFFVLEEPRLSRTGRVAEDVLTGVVAVMLGSALLDIATAPLSAYRHNENNSLRVQVAPRVSPILDQAGLAVHLRF